MSLRFRWLAGALVSLMAISSCGASSDSGPISITLNGEVSIDDLLVPTSEIPEELIGKLSLTSSTKDVSHAEFLDIAEGAKEYRIRSWLDNDGKPVISQVLYGFRDEDHAANDFVTARNGRNYHLVDGLQAVPLDVSDYQLKADKANVYCVQYELDENISACDQWGYRGKYGRFIVDVILNKYIGNNKYVSIETEYFLRLVQTIDNFVKNHVPN